MRNKTINNKIPLKFLKTKTIGSQKVLFFKKLEENKSNNSILKKNSLFSGSGYFSEDFSLNIYKSTSLFKNRYQIEPKNLKKELKLIHVQKKSKENENIIKSIKKNIIESSFSSDLLRLIKSKKVDRFVKRFLDIKNNKKINSNNIKRLTLTNNTKKIINPKNIFHNEVIKRIDEDKINTEDIFNRNSFLSLEDIISNNEGKNQIQKMVKNQTISSGTQTCNFNQFEGYKVHELKFNTINRPRSHTISKKYDIFRYTTPYYNSKTIRNQNNRKLKLSPKKFNNNKVLWTKYNKKGGFFTYTKSKSSLNNDIIINNKKLIFSFYDPNDKHIKLFKELEMKLKRINSGK